MNLSNGNHFLLTEYPPCSFLFIVPAKMNASGSSAAVEDYLERILELINTKGYARVVDIATSLGKLFLDAINDPATKPIMDSRGLVAIPQDGPTFQAQITKDRERWAKVVKQGNIRADNN